MSTAPHPRARLQTTVGIVVAFGLWRWLDHPGPLVVAFALALLAWAWPSGYAPVGRTLQRCAHALAVALTWAVLGCVYFGVFTPLRLLRSLTSPDPLRRKFEPAAVSYLHPLPKRGPDHFRRQF